MKNGAKKITKIATNLVLVLAIIIFAATAASAIYAQQTGQDLFFFGYKPFIITSGSMHPQFKVNSLVVIKKDNFAKAQTGDVIAFKPAIMRQEKFVLHRVVEQTPAGLITKGDNNQAVDLMPVTQNEFVGFEVWHTNLPAHISQLIKGH